MQQFYSPKTLVTWDVRAPVAMATQSIISAILICTTPKGSPLRVGSLPILLYLALVCVRTASAFSLQVMMYLGFAVCGYVNVFHCFNHLCLHTLDDSDVRREMAKWKSSSPNPGWVERIYFTTAMLWSFRGIGTDHEIKGTPRFPGKNGQVPAKRAFLLTQVFWIVVQYLFMDLITFQPQPPEAAEAWAVGKEWLWLPLNPHPVTHEDLVSRLISTLMSWYLFGMMMLDTWYRVFAIVFVSLGISEVKQWPPMYGSYSACYSLRGYFGDFWHQCMRSPLQGVALYVTRDMLGLKRSLAESYLTMLLVFLLSGHFHILLDYCSGMTSWKLSGGVQCFLLFVPGIMFEDAVRWVWPKVKAKAGIRGIRRLERGIGYVWTFLFLAAVTPVFNYPLQRITRNPTYVVPWSVFKRFLGDGDR
ncbi:membrane bound O-acyl transferase family-domain-containing protein [Immersiella caudata]|uniref:Membrane bound O-acyl transferase family-domain-containing protein n=1 Tax=Immersiella caudata TaxID=314043 RepID=A0AA39WLC3_9PEZI|nr:membrane bound O-acyl transferase family-domain-containing protein [Immersiella caudata]